jgi:hypothetical protein
MATLSRNGKDGQFLSPLYDSLKLLLLIVLSTLESLSARQARVPLYRDGH